MDIISVVGFLVSAPNAQNSTENHKNGKTWGWGPGGVIHRNSLLRTKYDTPEHVTGTTTHLHSALLIWDTPGWNRRIPSSSTLRREGGVIHRFSLLQVHYVAPEHVRGNTWASTPYPIGVWSTAPPPEMISFYPLAKHTHREGSVFHRISNLRANYDVSEHMRGNSEMSISYPIRLWPYGDNIVSFPPQTYLQGGGRGYPSYPPIASGLGCPWTRERLQKTSTPYPIGLKPPAPPSGMKSFHAPSAPNPWNLHQPFASRFLTWFLRNLYLPSQFNVVESIAVRGAKFDPLAGTPRIDNFNMYIVIIPSNKSHFLILQLGFGFYSGFPIRLRFFFKSGENSCHCGSTVPLSCSLLYCTRFICRASDVRRCIHRQSFAVWHSTAGGEIPHNAISPTIYARQQQQQQQQ